MTRAKECACGCGGIIQADRRRPGQRYIMGHGPVEPLTPEQKERAGREPACRVPRAVAAKASRGRAWLFDDLLDVAQLAYVQAARSFDPARSPGGESAWPAYAHWRVEKKVFRHRKRMLMVPAILSLDDTLFDDAETMGSTVPAPEPDVCPVEARDVWDVAMSRLHGMERAAVILRFQGGLGVAEAAGRIGRGRDRARDMIDAAIRRLRHGFFSRRVHTPGSGQRLKQWIAAQDGRTRYDRERKRKKACARAAHARAAGRAALGLVLSWGYYAADTAALTLAGPFTTKAEAQEAYPGLRAVSNGTARLWQRSKGYRAVPGRGVA